MKTMVVKYLMEHYGITEDQAINFVDAHPSEIESAERWGSASFYPAKKIAEAEKIEHREPCAACIAEEVVV